MSLKPLSFSKMDEQTDDIYEAVVMSRRSKQILRDRLVSDMINEEENESI